MNKLTSGLIEEFHKPKTNMFNCFSLTCGGSSTIEAKQGHIEDFVERTMGAPSVC
jgi:hypothetical protein